MLELRRPAASGAVTLPGSRRAAVEVIHALLASEAALRAGDAEEATTRAVRALEKAADLGLAILSEDDWLELIEREGASS